MTTYAKADDVQAVLVRELAPEEVPMVERRLTQVKRMILRRIPDLADRIDAGDLDEADVVDIEAEAVLRLVRNPGASSRRPTATTPTSLPPAATHRADWRSRPKSGRPRGQPLSNVGAGTVVGPGYGVNN